MRHCSNHKHFGRTSSHRKAMRRNMAQSLIEHGAIRTTAPKAKDLRKFVERMVSLARRGTLQARRQVICQMGDRIMVDKEGSVLEKTVIQKLFDEVAPRYADRPGGYTRIIRLADRRIGDAGSQVVMQLVEQGAAAGGPSPSRASRRRARARKRREHAEAAGAVAAPGPEETSEPGEPGGPVEPSESSQPPAEGESSAEAGPTPQSE